MPDPQPLALSPEEQDAIARHTRLLVERNELLEANRGFKAELDLKDREIAMLREALTISERKRDMFQRHAVALFTRARDFPTRLRQYADELAAALKEAHIEATQGGAAEVQPQDLDALNDGLNRIVSNLKPESET